MRLPESRFQWEPWVAGDLVETARPTLTRDDDLDVALRILDRENVDEIAAVDAVAPRRLVGSVHRRDVIAAHREEQARRDAAGSAATGVRVVERVQEVDVLIAAGSREALERLEAL
jgi:CBS domain-containing protein